MVCARRGIENPSAEYLAGYVRKSGEVPPISLDSVMKAAGLIEDMGERLLEARKAKRPA